MEKVVICKWSDRNDEDSIRHKISPSLPIANNGTSDVSTVSRRIYIVESELERKGHNEKLEKELLLLYNRKAELFANAKSAFYVNKCKLLKSVIQFIAKSSKVKIDNNEQSISHNFSMIVVLH